MRILSQLLAALLLSISVLSQEKVDANFGKITQHDFDVPASPVIDSNTNAVILSNVGSTDFIGNENHWFSYVYKKHLRIKIINEKALDISTVKIRLYGKDKLSDLKAVTYNTDNGNITTTELNQADIFQDKLSDYISVTKFTLPTVKAGSIIEYSYTITSYRYSYIPTWSFQNYKYPCLYSEYKVVFPMALRYVTVRYGLDSFFINKTSEVKNNHYNMGDISVVSNDIMDVWAMRDVPAFKSESFLNSSSDYLDKIEFVLAQTYNGEDLSDRGTSWTKVSDQLLNASYFGLAIDADHSSNLFNTADKITSHSTNLDESAHKLYYYIRDNFTCIPDDEIYLGDDLWTINKKKKGNVAEINLLLTALLRQKGILADPVILSTTDYGKNSPDYPMLDKMNYVICMTRINGDTVYLDASRPDLGFGNLSIDCYNGHARIISRDGGSVYFLPEKIHEQKNTNVIIYKDEKGKLSGSIEVGYGVFGSEKLREEIKRTGQEKYFDDLKSKYTNEVHILTTAIDSLSQFEFPVTVHSVFTLPFSGEVLYFDPMVISAFQENPFPAEQRKYPVVFSYPVDDRYVLSMEIPEGYEVDELPKSTKVSFNGGDGYFEYLIQKDQNQIQFRSHIKLNETVFSAEDYNSLRDFFAFIIKKYNEQIVFKRKKGT